MFNSRLMTSYFPVLKSRASEDWKTMSAEKNTKQRSLSLKRPLTPKKQIIQSKQDTPPKVTEKSESVQEVVDLISDSEDEGTPPKRQNVTLPREAPVYIEDEEDLDLFRTPKTRDSPQVSQNTTQSSDDFKQTVSPVNLSSQSAESIVCNVSPSDMIWVSPKTPSKSPKTPSKSPSTPSSRPKYFSPTKKRSITKKSPVKRKLSLPFSSSQGSSSENKPDDKTFFLLDIVQKFLGTESLKCLLDEESQTLLNHFVFLENVGMRLVCRLYWYQHRWYNADEVVKITVVDDLQEIIKSLVDCGFIILSKSEGKSIMELDEYLKILKKPVIDEICKKLKIKITNKKSAIESLKSFCKQAPISNFFTKEKTTNRTRVMDLLQSTAGICYKLSDLARTTLNSLYVLMYLGMDFNIIREKKLELMLLHDKTKAETFPVSKDMVVDNASVVFQDKDEFYRYLQAYRLYEDYVIKSDENDANESCAAIIRQAYKLYQEIDDKQMQRYQSLPVWLRRYTAALAYIKIMADGVQVLKRLNSDEHLFAIEILDLLISQTKFRTHKKALWYVEKSLILQRYLKNCEKSARVLIEGFESDMPEQLKDALRPRARLLANQKNIELDETLRDDLRRWAATHEILEASLPCAHIKKQPMDNLNMRGKLKFKEHTPNGKAILSVENACLLHYISNGDFTHGEHWEGSIAVTIFTLLFFDIIYTPPRGVTGVFLTPYQRYPLDMFCESFYTNRKEAIDERLRFIEEGTLEDVLEMMKKCWDERPESELSDIRRKSQGMEWESVSQVTSCLSPRGAAALCGRLARNYAYCHSGFPDLTLWNIHTNKVKFLEVKSDSDKPSIKQLQWLQYLLDNGIDAGFCYVGAKTTRCKARASDPDNLP